MNAKLRAWNMVLLGLCVLGAIAGWIVGRDPSQLMVVFGALTASQTALEAGMVGKRHTFKVEATNAVPSDTAPSGGKA